MTLSRRVLFLFILLLLPQWVQAQTEVIEARDICQVNGRVVSIEPVETSARQDTPEGSPPVYEILKVTLQLTSRALYKRVEGTEARCFPVRLGETATYYGFTRAFSPLQIKVDDFITARTSLQQSEPVLHRIIEKNGVDIETVLKQYMQP